MTNEENTMNTTLNFEAEPFEMEAGAEEFAHEEAGSDFESYETTEDFEWESTPAQVPQAPMASPHSAHIQQALHRHRNINAKLVKTIGALNKYVVKRNGVYHFTLPARGITEIASQLGVDPRMVSMMLKSLKKKNARLRAARVTQSELELEGPGCAGRSAIETHWWGRQIWLDECQTKTLINTLKAGAAGGGGCAAVVPIPHVKAACAALGAASGVSAYGLEAIDSLGGNQGIIIYWPWAGGAWPWHQ
jgi:hypothetical protein